MNLCIDIGNTAVKAGFFAGDELVAGFTVERLEPGWLKDLIKQFKPERSILSSTAELPDFVKDEILLQQVSYLELTAETPLPFVNSYLTPTTLGKDRLAAVAGAQAILPASDILVIDAGTAITFDFIDASGLYHGGNIAPGIEMRARALNQFTSRLPLIDPVHPQQLLGNDTQSAINNGIVYGAVFEIDGYIDLLVLKYPKLSAFLTGGSSFYFDGMLKNRTFAVKNLVLTGLNRILNFNV